MKNKKEKKQEEEELTGMAAVWDYLKTFLCCICDEQTGVYQCRDSVGIYAEYDYERRPGAGKPSGIYQR